MHPNPKAQELITRTAEFAGAAVAICERLPRSDLGKRIAMQLIDAATAVSSNYRAACRAKSRADFISKIGTVTEEADECCGWLELIISSNLRPEAEVSPLLDEAVQLTKIFAASLATAKRRDSRKNRDKATPNHQSRNKSPQSPNNPITE